MAGDKVPTQSFADANRLVGGLPEQKTVPVVHTASAEAFDIPGASEQIDEPWRIRDIDVLPGTPDSQLEFTCLPNEVSEEVSPNWSEMGDVIGRSAPVFGYASTGARTISFQLMFFAVQDAREEVFRRVQWLQSLKYPEYQANFMLPPHRVRVMGGKWLYLLGFVEQCSVQWGAPWARPGWMPMKAEISLTVKEIVTNPYDYKAVRGGLMVGGWTA